VSDAHVNKIGALAGGDFATVVKTDRGGGGL
jgi:hypothetical protein